jgi:hypothetical protein
MAEQPVSARPRRHLPRGLYEARPFIAMAIGGAAAMAALAHALSLGEESVLACGAMGAGCLLVLYGGLTKQMRNEHRRRIRMIAEIKAEWRNREAMAGIGAALDAGAKRTRHRSGRFAFLNEPYVRGAIACMVGGTTLAAIALVGSLGSGELSVWQACELALGSIIAVYGGLLHRVHLEA